MTEQTEREALEARCINCCFWQHESRMRGICKSPVERAIINRRGGAFPTSMSFGKCDEFAAKDAAP